MLTILGLVFMIADKFEIGITILFIDSVLQLTVLNKDSSSAKTVKNTLILLLTFMLFIKIVIHPV
jgi:hypothetical protein